MTLKVKKLSENAFIPTRANEGDAGLDLYSVEDYTLKPGERKLFKTDIAMTIPPGHYGSIRDRSGNAYKKGLHVMGGVIDEIFRGNIGCILLNTNVVDHTFFGVFNSHDSIQINKGDKIAQIIIQKYYNFPIEEVDELEESVRGGKGFGSSDKQIES